MKRDHMYRNPPYTNHFEMTFQRRGSVCFIVLLFTLISNSYQQVISKGKCPDVKVVSDFKLDPYLGDWYEIYKFKANFENGQSCIHANYMKKDNGHIQVLNKGQASDGKIISAVGDGYSPDPNVPAKLAVKFASVAPYGKYWILDTDYQNYSLVYSCEDLFSITHVEFAWILSRQRTLNSTISAKLFNVMKSYNINTTNFLSEEQTNCKT